MFFPLHHAAPSSSQEAKVLNLAMCLLIALCLAEAVPQATLLCSTIQTLRNLQNKSKVCIKPFKMFYKALPKWSYSSDARPGVHTVFSANSEPQGKLVHMHPLPDPSVHDQAHFLSSIFPFIFFFVPFIYLTQLEALRGKV